MVLAAALVGILYGQREDDRRDARVDAVSLYIRRVNGVRPGLAGELRELNNTYLPFASGPEELAGAGPRLEGTVRTMRALRARLAA